LKRNSMQCDCCHWSFPKLELIVSIWVRFLPSKKAILMSEASVYGLNTGVMQESYALRHKEYLELLEAFRFSVEEEQRLFYELKILQVELDMKRSIMADRRAEMGGYGYGDSRPAPQPAFFQAPEPVLRGGVGPDILN